MFVPSGCIALVSSARPTVLRVPAVGFRGASCPYSTSASAGQLAIILKTQQAIPKQQPAYTISCCRPFSKAATPQPRNQVSSTQILGRAARSQRRPASTTPQTPHDQDASAAASIAARNTTTSSSNEPALDWNTFFKLRRTRRRVQLAFSAVTALAAGAVGAYFIAAGSTEWVVSLVPLDPVITLGLLTFGFVGLGWLVGPSIGSQVFYAMNRKWKGQMMVKEGQFFARIKKNRVDPSNSSAGNPVPDFYGEKIGSVAGYRQWLKDQRAYNKKRTTFV